MIAICPQSELRGIVWAKLLPGFEKKKTTTSGHRLAAVEVARPRNPTARWGDGGLRRGPPFAEGLRWNGGDTLGYLGPGGIRLKGLFGGWVFLFSSLAFERPLEDELGKLYVETEGPGCFRAELLKRFSSPLAADGSFHGVFSEERTRREK